jgi:hypothetical protein
MRIKRNDELRPVNSRPDSKVNMIAPNHPPQIEIQALTGAPIRRSWKEVPDSLTCHRATIHTSNVNSTRAGAKVIKSRPDIFGSRVVSTEKEALDRSRGVDHVTQHHKQRDEILSPNPPMPKTPNRSMASARIKLANESAG